jgi:hypothetical protein
MPRSRLLLGSTRRSGQGWAVPQRRFGLRVCSHVLRVHGGGSHRWGVAPQRWIRSVMCGSTVVPWCRSSPQQLPRRCSGQRRHPWRQSTLPRHLRSRAHLLIRSVLDSMVLFWSTPPSRITSSLDPTGWPRRMTHCWWGPQSHPCQSMPTRGGAGWCHHKRWRQGCDEWWRHSLMLLLQTNDNVVTWCNMLQFTMLVFAIGFQACCKRLLIRL